MEFSTIFERLQFVISKQLEAEISKITPQASFANDLGADEIDITDLMMALEKEFDIEISDEVAEWLATVQQTFDYISSNVDQAETEKAEECLIKEAEKSRRLIESIASFWNQLEISEAEALNFTKEGFKVIKSRRIAAHREELKELKVKLETKTADLAAIKAQIQHLENQLELENT